MPSVSFFNQEPARGLDKTARFVLGLGYVCASEHHSRLDKLGRFDREYRGDNRGFCIPLVVGLAGMTPKLVHTEPRRHSHF